MVSLGFRTVLEALQIAGALALTAMLYRRKHAGHPPVSPVSLALLWLAWFLAAPYAHFTDELFLTYPMLLVLGRNGEGLRETRGWVSLDVLLFSLLLFSWSPGGVQLLWLPLLGIAALWSLKRVEVPHAALAETPYLRRVGAPVSLPTAPAGTARAMPRRMTRTRSQAHHGQRDTGGSATPR